METQGAKVIPWGGKTAHGRQEVPAADVRLDVPSFAPLDDLVIVLSDEHLEALAAAFLMNPARRAMTFEAYVAARGFAR